MPAKNSEENFSKIVGSLSDDEIVTAGNTADHINGHAGSDTLASGEGHGLVAGDMVGKEWSFVKAIRCPFIWRQTWRADRPVVLSRCCGTLMSSDIVTTETGIFETHEFEIPTGQTDGQLTFREITPH